MSADPGGREAIFLSTSWWSGSELAFATRAVAGAASRSLAVRVIAPGAFGQLKADGAFDVIGLGQGASARWGDSGPNSTDARFRPPGPHSVCFLDEPSEWACALLSSIPGATAAISIAPLHGTPESFLRPLDLVPGSPRGTSVGVHVPVNPLARFHRHGGLGFIGYLLVLTNRSAKPDVNPPTPEVAWITARFHDRHVVVLEGGRAAVWKGRSLRGIVNVDSRTDFWRLLAHAQLTVDLAPGDVVARECIESLRLGTPIIAPRGTKGAAHADAGGGLAYADVAGLLDAIALLDDPSRRGTFSRKGSGYADSLYGDPDSFVAAITRVLETTA